MQAPPQTPDTERVVVVSPAAVGVSSPASINTDRAEPATVDLLAGASNPVFEEDSDDYQIGVGCGGGCPPVYQLETEAKDSAQIKARIRYCFEKGLRLSRHMTGPVRASASIDAAGHASNVKVEIPPSITSEVGRCVQKLVESARFSSKHQWAREASDTQELPAE